MGVRASAECHPQARAIRPRHVVARRRRCPSSRESRRASLPCCLATPRGEAAPLRDGAPPPHPPHHHTACPRAMVPRGAALAIAAAQFGVVATCVPPSTPADNASASAPVESAGSAVEDTAARRGETTRQHPRPRHQRRYRSRLHRQRRCLVARRRPSGRGGHAYWQCRRRRGGAAVLGAEHSRRDPSRVMRCALPPAPPSRLR